MRNDRPKSPWSRPAGPSEKSSAYHLRKNRQRKKDAEAHAHRKNARRPDAPGTGFSVGTPKPAPKPALPPTEKAQERRPRPSTAPHPFQKFFKQRP